MDRKCWCMGENGDLMNEKTKKWLILFCATAALLFILTLSSQPMKHVYELRTEVLRKLSSLNFQGNKNVPVILAWTVYFSEKFPKMWERQRKTCPDVECVVTDNKALQKHADAVIFHIRDMSSKKLPVKNRPPNQVYVFFLKESPYHTGDLALYPQNFFNWTASYRTDSDIFTPYGKLEKRAVIRNQSEWKGLEMVLKRKKLVAWFASNCHTASQREHYVKELRKYVKVDAYGACGTLSCPRSKEMQCRKMLSENYKFYLSLENSVCTDYVTEKFYHRYVDLVVPIVLSRKMHEKFAPGNSFIAASDFSSVKKLAKYLMFLDKNPLEYLKYFSWRRQFDISFHGPMLCNLCRKLWYANSKNHPKSYENIARWWKETNVTCVRDFALNPGKQERKIVEKTTGFIFNRTDFGGLKGFLTDSDVKIVRIFLKNNEKSTIIDFLKLKKVL